MFVVILTLSLLFQPVAAQESSPCTVVIQFYNEGTPGTPGVSGDRRYGVRLTVQDVGDVVLPADNNGFVRFATTQDTVIPFTYVQLYRDPFGDGGLPQEAGCGFTAIRVPAGA